jgi:two-component system LytT family response regulator
MMIRALLIDDEKRSIDALMDLLSNFTKFEVAGAFTNPIEALERSVELEFNTVFLDIEMPGMHGLEVAKRILDMDSAMEIIFVSAHDQYVLRAAELKPIDFLLKPVSKKRMNRVMDKLYKKLESLPSPKEKR